MAIKYELRPWGMNNKAEYIGKIIERGTRNRQDLIAQMTGPGSILKPTECEAVLDAFFEALAQTMRNGYGYSDPHLQCRPQMRGIFDSTTDRYDPERHSIELALNSNKAFEAYLNNAATQHVPNNGLQSPTPTRVHDLKSQTTNQQLTPGHPIELKGEHLKIIAPDDTEQGVFFVHQGTSTRYRHQLIHQNHPTTLQVAVPESLTAGTYHIEVCSLVRPRNTQLRTGVFSKPLAVNP